MLKYKDKSLPIEERTKDLLSRMKLEEKVVQMIGFAPHTKYPEGMLLEGGKINDNVLISHYINGIGSLQVPFNSIHPEDKIKHVNYIQKFLAEETRLGIPALLQEECLHGHLALGATSFPIPLALASTWDKEIVEEVYNAAALEARARGGHQAFTPVVDICRDPRWGRIEETFGEDTCLVTEMGVSAVKGLQGTNENKRVIDENHIIASPKHFAGYAQSDGGRNFAPSHIPLRKLHDEILPPFKAVVQRVGALGIMPSHTDIDGVPCHGNKWLLTDLLRDKWGFEGFVVSDYKRF